MSRENEFQFVAVLVRENDATKGKQREDRNELTIEKNPYQIAQDAQRFIRWAKSAHRIAESICNGFCDGRDADRAERRMDAIRTRADALAHEYGASAEVTGDPRGFCLRLHFASGAHNTWGGRESGYGVPTR